jgi:selenocysteine lyase/cysteine desulfurase
MCDAVLYAAHFPVGCVALGCDFLLSLAYKFYGPHIGVLVSRPGLLQTLDADRLRARRQAAPTRSETATLNHPALLGVTAVIEFLADLGTGPTHRARLVYIMQTIGAWEHALAQQLAGRLATLPGVTLHSPPLDAAPRVPTLSITLAGIRPQRAAQALAARGL